MCNAQYLPKFYGTCAGKRIAKHPSVLFARTSVSRWHIELYDRRVYSVGGDNSPEGAKATAYAMLQARGMGDDQYSCLVSLWNKESGWNYQAMNRSSGAFGIPQALPGSKMSSAGADWQTNAATQISWGLGYISSRYGDPCGAWAKSQSSGWY